MTRAIVVNFHKYTSFGGEFYSPILDFFLKQMKKYADEYDQLYILDSAWHIPTNPLPDNFWFKEFDGKVTVIESDPSLRYYDAFKAFLPHVKEDLVLFLDNDTVIYREGVIKKTFRILSEMYMTNTPKYCTDVVTIMDTIGTWKSDKLKLGNKFCPYFFATRKDLLMKYLDVDWSPDGMPDFETFGKLTKAMVEDGVLVYEMEDDKNSIYIDGTQDGEKGKDFGFYHVRSGSLPAYLLATKAYGNKETYDDYIKKQPTREYLRQACWYRYMGGNWEWPGFDEYYQKFLTYHNLP